jgi:hypothetical protein
MQKYTQLTYEQRYHIYLLNKQGYTTQKSITPSIYNIIIIIIFRLEKQRVVFTLLFEKPIKLVAIIPAPVVVAKNTKNVVYINQEIIKKKCFSK